jgi:hypothetical protein
MLKLIVILSYNFIIRGSAGFYISILGMWLTLCGATLCCDYLRLSYFNLLILWDLLVFRCFPMSLLSANWIMCLLWILYMYTVPRGGTGGGTNVGTVVFILFYCKSCCVD